MTDKELGKNAEARIFSLSQMSKVKRVSTLPWREKMREASIFSEKFLELSLWACPCQRAASCQLCTGKSHGGHTAATCKEHSDQNQTHTSLSECLFNENRSKYFSKTSKVVVAEMTKPSTKAKKAKSENEVPLPGGLLSQKHNIMYIEVNRYTENTTLPHSNYTL